MPWLDNSIKQIFDFIPTKLWESEMPRSILLSYPHSMQSISTRLHRSIFHKIRQAQHVPLFAGLGVSEACRGQTG